MGDARSETSSFRTRTAQGRRTTLGAGRMVERSGGEMAGGDAEMTTALRGCRMPRLLSSKLSVEGAGRLVGQARPEVSDSRPSTYIVPADRH